MANPPYGLCLAQAMFKHGSDPMFITASLALIVELLVETRLLNLRIPGSVRTALVNFVTSIYRLITYRVYSWSLCLISCSPYSSSGL